MALCETLDIRLENFKELLRIRANVSRISVRRFRVEPRFEDALLEQLMVVHLPALQALVELADLSSAEEVGGVAGIGCSDEGAVESVAGSHLHASVLEVVEAKHGDARMGSEVCLCQPVVVFSISQEFGFVVGQAAEVEAHHLVVLALGNSLAPYEPSVGDTVYLLQRPSGQELAQNNEIVHPDSLPHQVDRPVWPEAMRHDKTAQFLRELLVG